ncbi:LIM-domain-containing protein [Thelephora ganbajun]|uniref:LIM-domain-containing protein n=1 Tax=Thelephora ganbajun TaxID=370292 RepID=A0ACB6ZJU1_THEGA|nr:LIM-domain-containing protein [Thelephora ganbajun]
MHPFGGSPRCPRCEKAVYAAEQVMGPGRKLYHKQCLTCMICKKRLDALSLVEHDEEAYSKNCHIKNFGTKDLRHANLPNRDQVMGLSPPTSPRRDTRGLDSPPSSPSLPTPASIESTIAGRSFTMLPPKPLLVTKLRVTGEAQPRTSGGRIGTNNLPGRLPLSPTKRGEDGETAHKEDEGSGDVDTPQRPQVGGTTDAVTLGRKNVVAPLVHTSTGTRYGRGLTGVGGGTNRQWGGGTPVCPKCGELVYFAEQTKAIGQTFHKGCLRCSECDTRLNPGRLSERDARPYCHRCYAKLYGPQGSGYALLGS